MPPAKAAPRQIEKLGQTKQTGKELILALLKGSTALTTSQIAAAWKKARRGTPVDNVLSLLVKAGQIKRTKVKGERGSSYSMGRMAVSPAKSPVLKAQQSQKRGQFQQTAKELVLSLLKGRRVLTTRQLGAAWKQAGRGGKVDNVLGQLVKAKKLKRKPLGEMMGSEYRAA